MKLKNKFFLFILLSLCAIFVSSCAIKTTVRISFDSESYKAQVGVEEEIGINIVTGEDYDEDEVRDELVYTSSNEDVVKFVDGKLIGVSYGEAEIKVAWSKKAIVFDTAKVIVGLDLPEVVYGKTFAKSMLLGTEQPFDVTLSYEDEHLTYEWKALTPNVADFKAEDKAVIVAKSVGTAIFELKMTDGIFSETVVLEVAVLGTHFNINYVLNGGVNPEGTKYEYNRFEDFGKLLEPSRVGYTFDGWYEDASFSKKITEITTKDSGDKSLYAKWNAIDYPVSYKLNGGSNAKENPATYTIEDEVVLKEATRKGYKFLGWYSGSDKVEVINAGSIGAVALEAKWEIIEYTITYDLQGGKFASETVAEKYTVEDTVVLPLAARDYYEFQGLFIGDKKVSSLAKGTIGDVQIVAKWTPVVYKISYALDGGTNATSNVATYTVEEAVSFAPATKKGHEFLGWYIGETKVEKFEVGSHDDVTLTAKWKELRYPITFDLDGGKLADDAINSYVYEFGATLPTPTKYLYKFLGWTRDGVEGYVTEIAATEQGEVKVKANWEAIIEETKVLTVGANEKYPSVKEALIHAKAGDTIVVKAGMYEDAIEITLDGISIIGPNNGIKGTAERQEEAVIGTITLKANDFKALGLKFVAKNALIVDAKVENVEFAYNLHDGEATSQGSMIGSYAGATVKELNVHDNKFIAKHTCNYYRMIYFSTPVENIKVIDNYFTNTCKSSTYTDFIRLDYVAGTVDIARNAFDRCASNNWGIFIGSPSKLGAIAENTVINIIENDFRGRADATESGISIRSLTDTSVVNLLANKFSYVAGTVLQFIGINNTANPECKMLVAFNLFEDTSANVTFRVAKTNVKFNYNYSYTDWTQHTTHTFKAADIEENHCNTPLYAIGAYEEWKFYGTFLFDIEYVLDGGVLPAGAVVQYPYGKVTKLPVPTKESYTFLGWSFEEGSTEYVTELDAETYGKVKLYANWVLNQRNITYVLDGGTNPADVPTTYIEGKVLALPTPTKAGYVFLGWTLAQNSTAYITELSASQLGDVTLYANWDRPVNPITYVLNDGVNPEGAPAEYKEGTGVTLPVPTKRQYKFLGWTLTEEGTAYVPAISAEQTGAVTLYAQWEKLPLPEVFEVGADKYFLTLQEALEAATEGKVIKLDAGTYTGDITITKNGISIIGPNDGKKYNDARSEEAVLDLTFTLAAGVGSFKVAGVKFINPKALILKGQNNGVEFASNLVEAKATAANTYVIYGAGTTTGVNIHDSKFVLDHTENYFRPVFMEDVAENITIENNSFKNTCSGKVYTDCIRINKTAGKVIIKGNLLDRFASNNWGFFIGYPGTYSAAAIADGTEIYILDNEFRCPQDATGSGISVRSLDATNKVEIMGNSFTNITGTIIQVYGGSAKSTDVVDVKVCYNKFLDSSTKVVFGVAKDKVVCSYNYGFKALEGSATFDTTEVITNPMESAEACDAAYAEYKKPATPVIVESEIEYVLNGGTLAENAPKKYTEGTGVTLPTPEKEGFEFLGWTLTETGTDYVTAITAEQTGKVTVYAQWKQEEVVTPETNLKVGAGQKYATIADALAVAVDGDVIELVKGEYELNDITIDKKVTIIGPNKGVEGKLHDLENEASITFIKVNVGTSYIKVDGVTLHATSPSSGNGFYSTATTEDIIVDNCRVMNFNSFMRFEVAVAGGKVTMSNSYFKHIGQFFIWIKSAQGANMKGVDFINNYVEEFGQVAASNGQLRMQTPNNAEFVINVIGNYFKSNSVNNYFVRSYSGKVNVNWNTFTNADKVIHSDNAGATVNADNNLYLDDEGNVVTTVPTTMTTSTQVTATIACQSEEARKAGYEAWLNEANKVVSNVQYELDGGTLPEGALSKYTEGEEFVLPVPTKAGFEFLGWTLTEEGTEYLTKLEATQTGDVTLYAHWAKETLKVGAGQKYATIAAALAQAKAGDVIELVAGEYDEDVTITVAGVTIIGPNKGVHGNATRQAEAVIRGTFTINANDVVVDGIKFTSRTVTEGESQVTKGGEIVIGGSANGVTIQNIWSDAKPVKAGSTNRYGVIVNAGAVSNIVIKDSYINSGSNSNQRNPISFGDKVTNIRIENNYLCNEVASGTVEGIHLYSIDGEVIIVNNTMRITTGNYIIYVGTNGNTAKLVEISNNLFAGKVDTDYSSGIRVQAIPANAEVNFVHNKFQYVTGNIFNFSNSNATAVVNIMYNNFDGKTAYKITALGNAKINYVNNLYQKAQTTATSDVNVVADEAQLEQLYNAYLASLVWCTVTFDLDGGVVEGTLIDKYLQGKTYELPQVTKEGYNFLGWTINEGTEYVTEISATQTGNITIHANWEKIETEYPLTLELDGGVLTEPMTKYSVGVVTTLPTPKKDGYVFLGWSKVAGSTEYVTEIPATQKGALTLYANWQEDQTTYKITYVLNGGNTLYANREALVNDFLKDITEASNVEITLANFRSKARKDAFQALINNDTLFAKWRWLFEYLKEVDKHTNSGAVYDDVLNNKTVNDSFWFLTRDFDGFLNKNLGNFYYSVSAVDFTKFAEGDGFWNRIQTGNIVDSSAKNSTILAPYYPFHTFVGWYETADFQGEPVKFLTKDCTLYAKWEPVTYKLTYHLNNNEATLSQEVVNVLPSDAFDLARPTYDERYWKFEGWYTDVELTTPIFDIKQYTSAPIDVYAKWTEIKGYTINYVLNGGTLLFNSHEDVINSFIADYSKAMNKTYVTGADIPTGSWSDIDYHTFYTKTVDGVSMRSKWLWLAEFLYQISSEKLAGNNCNVLGLRALVNETAYSGDAIYGVSYAFRGFLAQTTIRPGSSYTSVDFSIYENAHGYWPFLAKAENTEYVNNKGDVTLPTPFMENYSFDGWYLNPEFTGEKVTVAKDDNSAHKYYAKFVEAVKVESVTITNKVSEIKRFETLQLTWAINPADANIQTVKFESSNENVATVSPVGLITAIADGTCVIKITSLATGNKTDEFTLVVYSPDHFDVSYEGESYVKPNETTTLKAEYIKRDGTKPAVTFESLNSDIATVDANGVVTGVKAGVAKIRAKVDDTTYFDFTVTVLSAELSAGLEAVLEAHNSNVFTRYDLGIGAGKPAYYRDIYGSVSNLLLNKKLEINRDFEAAQNANSSNHGGTMSAVEFITVHYTGNMGKGSTAKANANYFAGSSNTSIHYVTGNDGVYHVLNDSLVAYHAGDGTGVQFSWSNTGVKWNATDPVRPVWGISANSKFTINGVETTISVPTGTTEATKKVTDSKWINDLGLAFKVVDGYYHMGTTWWCYSQIAEGRICSKGGNLNSIGIESAVNPEADLWLTWQMTAQLVAKLMLDNNLDITRVVGHHFFSAKDCPQPLLENNLEIWKIFLDMVEAEYKLLTSLKSYEIKATFDATDTNVTNVGRVSVAETARIVEYTVEVKLGDKVETVTLASAVNGIYSKCEC